LKNNYPATRVAAIFCMVMNIIDGNQLRILILGDEPELLEIYKKALSGNEQDLKVTCCRRAEKALEKVEAAVRSGQHFAVVFLDINFNQRFDGITVGEKIRQLDPHTNFAIVTGLPDISPQEIARRIPPGDKMLYVRKPFHLREIRQSASTLGAKWQSEVLLRNTNRELKKKVRELEQSRKAFLENTAELENATDQLMENNNALSVLARNLERTRKESEKRNFQRAVMLIMPIVEKLRQDPRLKRYRTDLNLLEGHVKDLGTGVPAELKAAALLSVSEMRIASMIRRGMTSREIALHLFISVATVKTHRKNIRKKLNLRNAPINLRTFLLTEMGSD